VAFTTMRFASLIVILASTLAVVSAFPSGRGIIARNIQEAREPASDWRREAQRQNADYRREAQPVPEAGPPDTRREAEARDYDARARSPLLKRGSPVWESSNKKRLDTVIY